MHACVVLMLEAHVPGAASLRGEHFTPENYFTPAARVDPGSGSISAMLHWASVTLCH